MSSRPRILGALLVDHGVLAPSRVDALLELQRRASGRIGELAVARGWAEPRDVARALSVQLGLPLADDPIPVASDAATVVPRSLAYGARAIAVEVHPRRLVLATDEPTRLDAIEDVRFRTGRRLELTVSWPDAVDGALARVYGDRLDHLVTEAGAALPDDVAEEGRALERAAASRPIVRLVDRLLHEAVERRASDLHLEPRGDVFAVRIRVDGVLREIHRLPARLQPLIVSRMKIMGGMDIAVRLRPQDGGLRATVARRPVALRISTLPVAGREKLVVRILDPTSAPEGLAALGLRTEDRERLERVLDGHRGVLLATGPTGSGKSSTLHAALRRIDRETRNVVTLEDPIEYPLPGATQVEVRPRAGLDFPAALRAVLRQDPDVVMVGEIRDAETAEIAMAAAVTGHMVLSSLHTNDAPSALVRLVQMGVPRHLVASGVVGVIAQRLVRTLCDGCRGAGCESCNDGWRGRTGVFQVMVVSDRLREALVGGAPTTTLERIAREDGMARLADDARRVVAEGRTADTEVARVLRAGSVLRPCPGCGADLPEEAVGCPWCATAIPGRCACGRAVESGWRFCPSCLRPAAR